MERQIILKNLQSPGDIVMLTAAVRDLVKAHREGVKVDVRTAAGQLWENNPYLTRMQEYDPGVEIVDCLYPLIHRSNTGPWHFIHGFAEYLSEKLELEILLTEFKGDIHLSAKEKAWMSQVQEVTKTPVPFWVVAAGGKFDYTTKWWDARRYQAVVDHFAGRVLFVQVGQDGHHHPPLRGVLDLRRKTNLRQLVRLVHHAQGVLCPVTLLMHLAAAVEVRKGMAKNRPCVVVAGGREPAQWEAYPHHQYIHTNGALRCCDQGGCWKSRVVPLGDGDKKDAPKNLCVNVVNLADPERSFRKLVQEEVPAHAQPSAPDRQIQDYLPRCLDLITAEEVIRRIQLYFDGGAVRYLSKQEAAAAVAGIPSLGWTHAIGS